MSWSYTAGAYYRLKGIFGSLIFGGYDASRFTRNDVAFSMTGDSFRDIVVTIRSITSSTSSGNTTLLTTPIFSFIDSSVAEIWLPVAACQAFENAFGLTLDQATGLYLLNSSTHENLLNLNPNITFTLADQKTGGSTVDLVLPYASFDLNVTAPVLPNRTSFYFPLKQTSDDTQYVLGRTFLQEAYVTADYNSRTFNVSQCIFDDTASAQVVAIPSNLANSTSGGSSASNPGSGTGSGAHKKLSGAAIAGIIIGALVGLLLLAALIFLLLRHRRRSKRDARPSTPVVEIDAGKRIEPAESTAYSAKAAALTSEVSGHDAKVEIQGNPIMHPQELEAEVPMAGGRTPSSRVSGPSDSSKGTGVSSMSPIAEQRTPMAELDEHDRGLGEEQDRGVDEEHIVSPNSDSSPTQRTQGMMGRREGNVSVSSRSASENTWTPTTPVKRRNSRFNEDLS